MKKLNRRALSVMMIALFIILGLLTYIERFLRDGESWASYFSRLNSLSEGYVTDRNGVTLFSAHDGDYYYAEEEAVRFASLHTVGDQRGQVGGTALSAFSDELVGYSFAGGTDGDRAVRRESLDGRGR